MQQRWKNARDSFQKVRTAKKQFGHTYAMKKMYLYYDKLQFLEKLDEQDDPGPETEIESVESPKTMENKWYFDTDQTSTFQPVKNLHVKTDDREKKFFVDVINETSQKLNDSDFSFFNSILPMVQELNDDEKLVFRSRMLEELINLRNVQKQCND